MFISNTIFHLIALCFLNSYHGLEQLPKDIAPTDEIRDVVNQIFSNLKLKRKQDSKLSEYSTIHKHFVGLTQLENDSWKRLTKLTRTDSKIDNGTTDLTTIINDILNEENNTVESNGTPNDDDVSKYIENFLSTLARLKDIYLVNDSYSTINTDVLEHFHRNSISENNVYKRVDEFNSTENSNSTDALEFWSPTETRRIFKGKKTKIKYFPFLASVHMFNQFTCAGSIIHSDLVITAASCLQLAYNNRFFRENPAFLAVRIGSPFYNAGGERIPVIEVFFHPSYSPRTLKNNIAIMRLERIIKFRRRKRNVKKIDIDRQSSNLPINTMGVTIVGWGAKTISNKVQDPWSSKVSMALLPIYPFEECQDVYSKEYVTRKNFCAGFMSKGGGACNRDVGAPGVVRGVLTGIASFGAPSCGTVDAPTVFTKVGYYYDWIETIMEQEVLHVKVKTTLRPYFVAKHVIPFEVSDEKDFKIAPLTSGIKKVIDSKNENRLRMDQNNHFENFLGTMFNGEDQKDQKVELPNVKRQQTKDSEGTKTEEENDKDASKIHEQLVTTLADAAEDSFEPPKFVTTMDTFDQKPAKSRESELDVGVNLTELENIYQTGEVDNSDIILEAKSKTTPILEEYGLSIELSDIHTVKDDLPNYDSERKHQINTSNELEKYTNDDTKFNQDSKHEVQEVTESKKDVNHETLKEDFDSQFNEKSKHQADALAESFGYVGDTNKFSEKSEDQLRDLEQFLNEENENTQFNNEMIQQVGVPEDSKTNLNARSSAEQLKQPDLFVRDESPSYKFSKNHSHQVDIQPKFQAELPDESIKYRDVITQLNKEPQHQVEEPQLSVNQKDEQDTLTRNRIREKAQFNEQPQGQVKGTIHQVKEPDISERHAYANTQTNKSNPHQVLKPFKSFVGIDYNPSEKERKKQVNGPDTIESNQQQQQHTTRSPHQGKNPEEFMKESKNQEEVISGRVLKVNTESSQFYENQVIKRDESILGNDANPLKNDHENVSYELKSFERNARPKFDSKLIHGIEEPGKYMHNIDSKEKHQVVESEVSLRHEDVYNQLNKNHENDVHKEKEFKNENFDKKLDEQIDQLIKNLDVEDKIEPEMIDHVNDRKVITDTKLLELMENKQDEKKELDNDTLLTFLLMTDNDRNRSETIKQNEGNDEDAESDGKEGFTIDADYYEDVTFRTNNVTDDDSYKIMSKSEMYDILADAIIPEGAVVV